MRFALPVVPSSADDLKVSGADRRELRYGESAMTTKSKSGNKAASKAQASGKAEKPKAAIDLSSLDEAALLEALTAKREEKRTAIVSAIEALNKQIEERTADLRAQIQEKQGELRALGFAAAGVRRNGNGGGINPKGATAVAILSALKGGPQSVKAMKAVPAIAALMDGKYEKSFMAVNLAALRSKGLVEQAERGVWRLTAEGEKAAAETATAAA